MRLFRKFSTSLSSLHCHREINHFSMFLFLQLILKTTKIKFAPWTEQQSAGKSCNTQKKNPDKFSSFLLQHMLPHTWWQLLPSAHNMGWQQTHSSTSSWNGALSTQFVQKAVHGPGRKTALDKTATPKHITASCCAQFQRGHYTPWPKRDNVLEEINTDNTFCMYQKDIHDVKNIAMYLI